MTLSGTAVSTAPQGGGGALVSVDFRAVTSAGSPIADLKVGDVTLKVEGRERAIRSFALLPIGDKPAGPARPTLPPPFATNTVKIEGTRDTLLVLDDESIAPGDEKRLLPALNQYLGGLGSGDRVGILTVQDRGLNVSLTSDREAIRKAMTSMVGRGRASETVDDAACRTRRNLGALVSVAGNFPPGSAPVTVLFFSTGLTPPGTATMSTMSRSSSTPTNMCEVQPRDYQQFQTATLGSSLNVYVVAAALAPSTAMQSGLENLAGLSGNAMVELVKGGDGDMVRVVRENTAWYRAAYEPEVSERNGAIQRVEVQIKRSGAEARVRPQIIVPKVDPKFASTLSAKDLLRDSRPHRDFEFRAAAFSSQEPGSDRVKLIVLFEPVEASRVIKSAVVGLYDAKGKLTVQGTAESANLARTPATIAILASPGVYRMRVAAVDAGGQVGTVDADVDVSLTRAGTLQLGSLLLGVADSGSFAGRLTFGPEPVAIAYLEIYGVAQNAQLSATVEIVDTATGPAVASGTTKILGDTPDGRRVVLGGVPIAQLPSGDALVRVTVSIDGKPAGQVTRTLRKR